MIEQTPTNLKSKLSAVICLHVKNLELTLVQVAEILGVDQARVNKLLAGNLQDSSIDFLIKALEKLDYTFQIDFDPTDEEAPLLIAVRKQFN